MTITGHFVLLLVVLLPLVKPAPDETEERKDEDIHEFFTAHNDSWVYNTTERNQAGETICRHDVMVNITEENIFFHRLNNNSGPLLRGEFINWYEYKNKPNDSIYVHDSAGNVLGAAILDYASNNKTCALLTVLVYSEVNTTVHHELRVAAAAIGGGPEQECYEKFDSLVTELRKFPKLGEQKTSHYSPSCQ
uniref:Putative lipocalin-3 1 n=1 Tax=Amblyomma tuberculatum TaxID=48802 RepID=A0A6M2E960_9ACAR